MIFDWFKILTSFLSIVNNAVNACDYLLLQKSLKRAFVILSASGMFVINSSFNNLHREAAGEHQTSLKT